MNSRLSPELAQVIRPIIEHIEPRYLAVTAKFFTTEDRTFVYQPEIITDVDVVQDFDHSLFDFIELGFTGLVTDFAKMIKYHQTLQCAFVLTLKENPNDVVGTEICSLTLRVIIKNMPDLEKENQISQLVPPNGDATLNPTQSINSRRVIVQLYDQVTFYLRKLRFNAIFRQTDIANVLYYMYNELKQTANGLKQPLKCYIRTPDNAQVYENLVIPPLLNWGQMIAHLQSSPGLGIYNQGCNCYYSNGIFAVYPQYDRNPPPGAFAMNFYIVSQRDLLGSTVYHYRDALKNYHIIINQDVQVKRETAEALENVGSGVLLQDASRIYNDCVSLQGDKVTVDGSMVRFIDLNTSLGIKDAKGKTYSPIFMDDAYNPYRVLSGLAAKQSTTMAFTWVGAIPYSITPGNLMLLHHQSIKDNNAIQKVIPCVCGSVVYSIRRVTNLPMSVYNCNATVILNCHDEAPETLS